MLYSFLQDDYVTRNDILATCCYIANLTFASAKVPYF